MDVKYCSCGCRQEIVYKPYHKYYKVKFIYGHQNRGKKLPKNSKWMRENRPSKRPEVAKKISESNKGKKRTEEQKRNISEGIKAGYKAGRVNPMTGKKRPAHSLRMKGNTYSKFPSKETIKKMKESRAKQIFPLKDSSLEVKIQNFLKTLNIPFLTHQYMKIKHGYQCDILIQSMNLVIECDGDYWHKYPMGNNIDHIRTKELVEQGFKVFRLWGREIKIMDIDKFYNELKKYNKLNTVKNVKIKPKVNK